MNTHDENSIEVTAAVIKAEKLLKDAIDAYEDLSEKEKLYAESADNPTEFRIGIRGEVRAQMICGVLRSLLK